MHLFNYMDIIPEIKFWPCLFIASYTQYLPNTMATQNLMWGHARRDDGSQARRVIQTGWMLSNLIVILYVQLAVSLSFGGLFLRPDGQSERKLAVFEA
jgi:hypothetical protein